MRREVHKHSGCGGERGGRREKNFNEDVEGVKENLGRGYMERNHSGSVETRGNL